MTVIEWCGREDCFPPHYGQRFLLGSPDEVAPVRLYCPGKPTEPVAHMRYDPACVEYRPPRGPDTQYLHDWHRGESCPVCLSPKPTREEQR